MKKSLFVLTALLLLGAGCTKAPVSPVPVADDTEAPYEVPRMMASFDYTEDKDYILTFPGSWKGVTSFEDFGGYVGESGPPDFDIPGKIRTFALGDDVVPMFVVIKIDLKEKGHKSIPAEDTFLGQNATSAFYGGEVWENSQEWSYLYDGRQDRYGSEREDIGRIFSSFKLK